MKKQLRAFSLLEMLVVLIILSIVATISLPNLRVFLSYTEDETVKQSFIHLIKFAQLQANLLRRPIALRKIKENDGVYSWIVFVNEAEDGRLSNKKNILSLMKEPPHTSIDWRAFPAYRQFILFFPMSRNDNATFWFRKDAGINVSWTLLLSRTGRLRFA